MQIFAGTNPKPDAFSMIYKSNHKNIRASTPIRSHDLRICTKSSNSCKGDDQILLSSFTLSAHLESKGIDGILETNHPIPTIQQLPFNLPVVNTLYEKPQNIRSTDALDRDNTTVNKFESPVKKMTLCKFSAKMPSTAFQLTSIITLNEK